MCKSLSSYSVGQMLFHMANRELVDYSRLWSVRDPLVFWTGTLVLALAFWVLTAHFYGFQMMRVGLHVRVGCSYLLYRKSLKLAHSETAESTMGKMVSSAARQVPLCVSIAASSEPVSGSEIELSLSSARLLWSEAVAVGAL